MTNAEKITAIKNLPEHPILEDRYYTLLEKLGDLKTNYYDYMSTSPIDVDKELGRLPDADYELCTAILTMLLREDRFCEGAFQRRHKAGQVDAVLRRMLETLQNAR